MSYTLFFQNKSTRPKLYQKGPLKSTNFSTMTLYTPTKGDLC